MNKTVFKTSLVMIVVMALMFSREPIETGHTTALKTANGQQVSEVITNPNNGPITSIDRDEIIIYSDDFEGEETWNSDTGWELTTDEYNSETHSWNSPNSVENANGSWNLTSPVISLPMVGDGEVMTFGFFLHADMPDSVGDGDNFLEDYYSVFEWIKIFKEKYHKYNIAIIHHAS